MRRDSWGRLIEKNNSREVYWTFSKLDCFPPQLLGENSQKRRLKLEFSSGSALSEWEVLI
jgi:hypothetical protein